MFGSQRVLFICTGNFYRSRFAEAVFNHEARIAGLRWTAFSRGIRPHTEEGNLSLHAEHALIERGITVEDTPGPPTRVEMSDLMDATLQIAMQRSEHEDPLTDRFGSWAERIEFWNVADIPHATPEEALPLIERGVGKIVRSLEDGGVLANEPFPSFVSEC